MRKGALERGWGETRSAELDEHLRRYVVVPIEAEIAEVWAQLFVRCKQLGRQKSENDLWIAATAKRYGLPLASLDRAHYDIPGLTVIRDDGTEIAVPE